MWFTNSTVHSLLLLILVPKYLNWSTFSKISPSTANISWSLPNYFITLVFSSLTTKPNTFTLSQLMLLYYFSLQFICSLQLGLGPPWNPTYLTTIYRPPAHTNSVEYILSLFHIPYWIAKRDGVFPCLKPVISRNPSDAVLSTLIWYFCTFHTHSY